MSPPRPCLVCGADAWAPHLGDLLRCTACAFVTADVASPIDPGALYGEEYFRGAEYLDYAADEAFIKRTLQPRLDAVLARQRGGRLLEIGSAYGFFLDLARAHFDVVGFEVSAAAAAHARQRLGLDVRSDDFTAATPASIGAPVDATVMLDVIEHLEHPDRVIAHVAAVSRPGALLLITTGDIGSWVARRRGRQWRLIHPPTHLHYFSRATLTRLLARHGFRVREIRAVPVVRSVRQTLYSILALRMGRTALYQRLERLIPPTLGFPLNTYDIMQVVAEYETQTPAPPR
jgi:SAM-dependent methyltransferase